LNNGSDTKGDHFRNTIDELAVVSAVTSHEAGHDVGIKHVEDIGKHRRVVTADVAFQNAWDEV
jgi:hypothetical protein